MLSPIDIPQWISYDLSPVCWVCMAVAFLASLWLSGVFVSRIRMIINAKEDDDAAAADPSSDAGLAYPPVSVIITSLPGTEPLIPLVEAVLGQEYPAPFEVIVVIDGVDHGAHDQLHQLMLTHSNLYTTFAPEDSRNLSRRKLSLMLGIKAAEYDMLMLTRGNCRILSPLWLRLMMRNAAKGSEVVVGWSVPLQTDVREAGRLRRAYDTLWTALTWLPRAVKGHPFMGTGCNLAYSRRLFFEQKGFSKSLHIKSGDDDMFLYEIAAKADCAVELSSESMVEEEVANARLAHRNAKFEHFFTAKWLPVAPSLMMGSFSLSWWVWLLSAAAACTLGLPSFLPTIIMALLGIFLVIYSALKWKALSRMLGIIPTVWSMPFLALWHPFYQLGYRLKSYARRKSNYTWNK